MFQMEKSIWEYVAGVPILGWLTYLQFTRPSRNECKAKHDPLCKKMDEVHTDIKEIRKMFIQHIQGK